MSIGFQTALGWGPLTRYVPAGPLTLTDIQGLFQPVPFGDPSPPSAFELAMAPQNLPAWEGFRNIDMDKQTRVLQVCSTLAGYFSCCALVSCQGSVHIGWCRVSQHQCTYPSD